MGSCDPALVTYVTEEMRSFRIVSCDYKEDDLDEPSLLS